MKQSYAWQQKKWPKFSWDSAQLTQYDQQFMHLTGVSVGIQKAISEDDLATLRITFLSDEAVGTSEIEGEILDRESVQSSIQDYLELKIPQSKNHPRENGIAQMMVTIYHDFDEKLSHKMLYDWHQMVMNGRSDLDAIGRYRRHEEPMQIVSRLADKPLIHYEAPPSKSVPGEMENFINWFNESRKEVPPLVQAGIAHLYFELIHPFEDGNGRVGRGLIEKVLAEALGYPTLIAVSQTIRNNRNAYYDALEAANKRLEITDWLHYFCQMILEAQQLTIDSIDFLIRKTRFFDTHASQLNDRQLKLMQRIFDEGLKGFTGGVSAKKYRAITKTTSATATRDLNDLVAKGIMKRTGERKTTRYWLVGFTAP